MTHRPDLAACDPAVPEASSHFDRAPAGTVHIPVLRSQLPETDRLIPYLRRIDASRTYSNFGPLVLELEQRLIAHFGLPDCNLVSASSGTAALVAAILALSGRATIERPFALMPSFTFVATAVAAEQCGYQPALADVDPQTWMLDSERLRNHPLLNQVGIVIVVAPFGRSIDQAEWQAFQDDTGVPVLIDAAAGFETVSDAAGSCLGHVPVMLSFHATKSFSTGEGGCIACTDAALIERIGQALNFGFNNSRYSRSASTNGKMSEFHAAVGLAELDGWPEKRVAMAAVATEYRRQLTEIGLAGRLLAAPEISSSYVLFRAADDSEATSVRQALDQANIGYRLWYGEGLRHQPYYATTPGEPLPVTEVLAPLLIGIPTAPDLPSADIAAVVRALSCGSGRQR
jgi:dTDP-4-amino-4,6-dideoxygalactose transaminase